MYTLKVGNTYLAPRYSIRVEESSDFEQLANTDQACGCSSSNGKRTFTFKLHFVGGCSLASAWVLYRQVQAAMPCDNTQVLLRRRVQDEPWLIYRITSSTLRMVDVINQYTRERVLTVEMKLTLVGADNPIITIYEHARFPKVVVRVTNPFNVVGVLKEEAKFPEPTDVFV